MLCCISRPIAHCDCDAAKVKAVTIIAEQRTWLKVVEQTHQNLVANFYGPIPTKLFVNKILVMIMYVIKKIAKIFYYKNLEVYGNKCDILIEKYHFTFWKVKTINYLRGLKNKTAIAVFSSTALNITFHTFSTFLHNIFILQVLIWNHYHYLNLGKAQRLSTHVG